MRPKWDERHHADGRAYGQGTIDAIIERGGQTYGSELDAEFEFTAGLDAESEFTADGDDPRTDRDGKADDPGEKTKAAPRDPGSLAEVGPEVPQVGRGSRPALWQGGRRQRLARPVPLPPTRSPAPSMSPDLLPPGLEPWLGDIASRTCLPLAFPAIPAVTALSAVVGRSVSIRPERHDDWVVVPNLWGALVAPPGSLKSTAAQEALAPLSRLAAKATSEHARAVELARAELAVIDAQEARVKNELKMGDIDAETARAQLLELGRRRREATPTERRYITQDATVEKLGELLRENPRGLLVYRDELSGWVESMDRTGHENDRAFYLEAWNGNGGYTFDRIGRGTVHIPSVTLAVLGGIQPGRLNPLVAAAISGGCGADGLLQRFQLLAWPDVLGAWKRPEQPPDRDAVDRAFAAFRRLADLDPASVRAEYRDGGIHTLGFAADAQATFDAWRDRLEHRLRRGELAGAPAFEAHVAKYRSLVPSLALLFHLLDVTAEGSVSGVTGAPGVADAALRMALGWAEFLEGHARKLYSAELERDTGAAHALAGRIKSGDVGDGMRVREIHRRQWHGLSLPDQGGGRLEAALRVLEDAGWLRVELLPGATGRSPRVVRLHPELGGKG